MDTRITRRGFVGSAAAAALAGSSATNASARPLVSANDKVRLGLIGAGSRGNQLLGTFFEYPEAQFAAVADVDDKHADETAERIKKKTGASPTRMRDYREMLDKNKLDAVVIATPDHWHALPTIHACMNGLDVYVEKPVAHNIAEGQAMIKAARKYDRIVAVGTQQRSSQHFQKAVETVRSGQLGKVFWVQTWNYENISPVGMKNEPDTQPPPYVDWDRWLGPAPKVGFNINRFHLLFRWWFDYAGGMMSDWGVHLNDIALWAINQQSPVSVATSGGIFSTEDGRDTPDTLQVVYDFPGCTLTYSMRKGNGLKFQDRSYGILFCGTDGSLVLDRSGYEIIPDKIDHPYGIELIKGKQQAREIKLKGEKVKGDDGQSPHIKNFLECLKTRKKPTCDIEITHQSTNTCHLGNIAYKVGRKLFWDQATETFKNDPEANKHLSREARKGYELPQI